MDKPVESTRRRRGAAGTAATRADLAATPPRRKPSGTSRSPSKRRPGGNAPKEMAHSMTEPSKEDTVRNQQLQERPTMTTKWAPWWVYLVIIVAANYLRRAALPDGSAPVVRVVLALGFSAALFVTITIIYRAATRIGGPQTT